MDGSVDLVDGDSALVSGIDVVQYHFELFWVKTEAEFASDPAELFFVDKSSVAGKYLSDVLVRRQYPLEDRFRLVDVIFFY